MKQEYAHIIQLPKIFDPRGSLTVAEETKNIPFTIKSVKWHYGMPAGATLTTNRQHGQLVIVALAGSFTIESNNEESSQAFFLNHPYQGLYLNQDIEYEITNCSSGAVILILKE